MKLEIKTNVKGLEVLKELDELIIQLIREAKEDPVTEKLKALTELLSARAKLDY